MKLGYQRLPASVAKPEMTGWNLPIRDLALSRSLTAGMVKRIRLWGQGAYARKGPTGVSQ